MRKPKAQLTSLLSVLLAVGMFTMPVNALAKDAIDEAMLDEGAVVQVQQNDAPGNVVEEAVPREQTDAVGAAVDGAQDEASVADSVDVVLREQAIDSESESVAEGEQQPTANAKAEDKGALAAEATNKSGTIGTCTWSVANGVLTIKPTKGNRGELPLNATYTLASWPWTQYKQEIKSVIIQKTVVAGRNINYMFYNLSNAVSIDASGLDTSKTTNMHSVFRVDPKLAKLNIQGWNTSKVTEMSAMFVGCESLQSLDVRGFDTRNVRAMHSMFGGCKKLQTIDLSSFNTSNVTDMGAMFSHCTGLRTLDLGNFDTRKVQTFGQMFFGCSSLTAVNTSKLRGCGIVKWAESLGAEGLGGGPGTISMFKGCSSLGTIDLSSFDMPAGIETRYMYDGCTSLNTWKIGKGYRTNLEGAVPAATSSKGWWSCRDMKWFGAGKIASSRSGKADTYTNSAIKPSVQYFVHRQTYGWEKDWSKRDGQQSGTTGQAKRLESIKIRVQNKRCTGSIQYMTHIQTYGWEKKWRSDGALSGTTHQAKRLEAIRIRLTGDLAAYYDVYYRVHAQRFGWMGWAKNGAQAGTAGYARRLESIQIVLLPKGSKAPPAKYMGAKQNVSAAFSQKRG